MVKLQMMYYWHIYKYNRIRINIIYLLYLYIMKSALIITGNLRTFENCIQSYELLINKFDCDVFICMSNIQFDIHPYQKQILNFYNDNTLTLEIINNILKTSKNLSQHVKNVILLDKNEEDTIIMENFLHKFDRKKDWIGIDIFKQYYKIKLCADYIKEYELINNIKYDYIIKSRFDLNIDINSLPSYPLNNNTFYSVNYGEKEINDTTFIVNNINTLDCILNNIIKHFYKNEGDINIYKSIHTLLYYILQSNSIVSIKQIVANIDRNYHLSFDMNVTLVTCFYNINRENWQHSSRPIDKYFTNCQHILNKKNPIVIFTSDEYKERCTSIRKKTDINLIYTTIIIIPFEKLYYYDNLDIIRQIQINNIDNIFPIHDRSNPEFCVPEYIVVINNKIHFLKEVADKNLYNSQIFQWVDFGLHPNTYIKEQFNEYFFSNIFYKKDKIRLVSFKNPVKFTNTDMRNYYNSHCSTLSAGLIAGDKNSINVLHKLYNEQFSLMIQNNVINQEQYILYYIMCTNPELFDYSLINNWDNLCKSYQANNINVALCMSGHLRTYDLCKQNIKTNIFDILKHKGFNVNIFLSSWDTFSNNDTQLTNFNIEGFNNYDFEPTKEEYFIKNFSTNDYLKYTGLCCNTTSSNAISCFYKMYKSFCMTKTFENINHIKYDIIIRMRPDIIYNNLIDIGVIKKCLLNDRIYMPFAHGKYTIVTKYMMDHYFLGNINTMEKVMLTYENINNIIKTECPHTFEGFLWKQVNINNINIERFMCSYGIIRKNNIYESLFN